MFTSDGMWDRRIPTGPAGFQLGDGRALCPKCLSEQEADAMYHAGMHVGDIHPWTVDLWPGDEPVRCTSCHGTIVAAPPYEPDDD